MIQCFTNFLVAKDLYHTNMGIKSDPYCAKRQLLIDTEQSGEWVLYLNLNIIWMSRSMTLELFKFGSGKDTDNFV